MVHVATDTLSLIYLLTMRPSGETACGRATPVWVKVAYGRREWSVLGSAKRIKSRLTLMASYRSFCSSIGLGQNEMELFGVVAGVLGLAIGAG